MSKYILARRLAWDSASPSLQEAMKYTDWCMAIEEDNAFNKYSEDYFTIDMIDRDDW